MLDRAEVERHLAGLLASAQFLRAPKHAAFLRFVTACTLDGRQDSIKEAVIASEVYGRTDYDPAIDSLIRVEASRLRKRLDDYYAHNASGIRITLPKGAYVPVFAQRHPSPGWRWPWRPLLAAAALAAGLFGWNLYRGAQVRALLAEAAAAIPVGKDFAEATFAERGPKGLDALMGAATTYQRVLDLDAANVAALEGLSKVYYRALDYDPALGLKMAAVARRLLAVQPDSSEARFYLAYYAHFHEKNYARSNQLFRSLLESRPDDEGLYRYVFLSAAAMGDPAGAVAPIERGMARIPHSPTVAITYASLLMMLERYAEVDRAMARLIAVHPNVPAAYSRRGWALFYLGQTKEAERHFHRCLELSAGEPSCMANLAFVYNRTARPRLAAPLQDALVRLPENSRHVFLAVTAMGRQDRQTALHHLDLAARANDPALPYLKPNPVFQSLRGDSVFERLFH